ncbi:Cytochrome b5 reductase 4 [Ceratocystis fimbriata CBS 114723]|uniref:Cytochrome b5 reductase 4 n=1 Tax=Ceratocystis fimbriata CBS 114723 TaxID=1035309 RepID=A0A2C5X494_9PEZI|nr:Cytochrome b5 reductase 4 [Ceratocystis fimbriata CBS 114723]
MGYIGISLIVATAVLVLVRPPPWLRRQLFLLFRRAATTDTDVTQPRQHNNARTPATGDPDKLVKSLGGIDGRRPDPDVDADKDADVDQTTPKATATTPAGTIPSLSLSDDLTPSTIPRPRSPNAPRAPPFAAPTAPTTARAPPRLPSFPAMNSPQRASGPAPNRRPGGLMAPPMAGSSSNSGGSGLAPPPSHSSIPAKPSRKVILTPGHSPLDWARISGPNSDLRGLGGPSAPFLKVTPTMLKKMTGRRGKDAWMAIGGKVYNVSPYAKFHPGGVPELMRGAARDATQLFGEIHPWVNYENMLQACLVGILVEEGPTAGVDASSGMDEMD